MRRAIANFIMWLVKPALGPMLEELNDNIDGLILRKVDVEDVSMGHDGSLYARDTTIFTHNE